MKISEPRDLLVHELKDLYSAETQLLKALPRLAKAATSKDLKKTLESHAKVTKKQADRLEKVMKQLDEPPRGKKCVAMEGLIEEGRELLEEDLEGPLLDLALIGAAQKIEHYEIAGYGTARTLAQLAGEEKIAAVLQQTLDEEGDTDKRLTDVAMSLSLATVSAEAEEE